MLSGGIDSPVAGYLAMKRGIKIEAIYFESPPHTSIDAKNKVKDLARVLANYNINSIFPSATASDNEISGKYYVGTYAFSVFSPRVSADGKYDITVSANTNQFDGKSTSNENYSVSDSFASINNSYYCYSCFISFYYI